MPIDPRIALGFQAPEYPGPINALGNVLALQGQMRQNQLGEMQLQQSRADMEDAVRFRNALAGDMAAPDFKARLLQASPSRAQAYLKQEAELKDKESQSREREAKLVTESITQQNKVADQFKMMWGQVQSPEQAAQINAAAYNHPILGPALKAMGATPEGSAASLQKASQNPQTWAQYLQSQILGADEFIKRNTMTLDQQLSQLRQAEQLKESQRHNKAQEGISYGNLSVARDRLAFDKAQPKGVLDPERGLLVDPRSGEARPVTMGGKPVGMKLDAATKKELTGLNQQESIIDGAIAAAKKTPSAFSLPRGMATMAGSLPETVAGRFDTKAEQEARAYVFNNVSRVINERAGAAQSAQELARLRSFLPAEADSSDQIVNKMEAFKQYLADMKKGTTPASTGASGSWEGWSIEPAN